MTELLHKFSAGKFWGVRVLSLAAAAGVLLILQYLVAPYLNGYDMRLIVLALLFGTLAGSLNIINGVTGQFSIGHAAFYMIGAYVSGKLTVTYFEAQPLVGWMWLIVVTIAGGVAAGFAGFIVGLPSLRLKGDYLAIVTLGFGEIARIVVQNQDGGDQAFFHLDLGGAYRLAIPPKLTEVAYVGLLLIFTIAVARNLLKTSHGLSFLATREDELAASAVGVNTTRTKVTAFVIGAALAGMAGALYAHYNHAISPDDFRMDTSFLVVTMVVIGGTGSITGAVVAGIALKLFEEALRTFSSIPAIDLMSYVIALIIVATAAIKLTKSMGPAASKKLDVPTGIVGTLGCFGLVYLGYLNVFSSVSPVIKAVFISIIFATLFAFAFTKARSSVPKFGFLILTGIVVYILKIPVAIGFHSIPFIQNNLAQTTYTPSDLRWAVYALTLILIMIVRPGGILGHHEFSWDFVKKLFGRSHQEQAIAA